MHSKGNNSEETTYSMWRKYWQTVHLTGEQYPEYIRDSSNGPIPGKKNPVKKWTKWIGISQKNINKRPTTCIITIQNDSYEKDKNLLGAVVHACDPSGSGVRGRRIISLEPASAI